MTNKIYGSANSEANLITDLYGGHNDQAQRITKLYGPAEETTTTPTIRAGGVGNVTTFDESVFAAIAPSHGLDTTKVISYLYVPAGSWTDTTVKYRVIAYYTDGTSTRLTTLAGVGSSLLLSDFGITASSSPNEGDDYIDYIQTTQNVARLIHQGFGHLIYT